MKKQITCPHCGDTWEYDSIIDYGTGKVLVTKDFNFIEDTAICNCYKCGGLYKPEFPKTNIHMYPFVYRAWRSVKGN